MKQAFDLAISNVVSHGDTDIFPFPIENHVFFDRRGETASLLLDIDANFDKRFSSFPPAHESCLAPVGYSGFRWATQLDPLWNIYFLGCVVSVADLIEAARLPPSDRIVFSYRYAPDPATSDLFRRDLGWAQFMQTSIENAANAKYVVTCDISDFYPRIGHHRLDNALLQLKAKGDAPRKIIEFLKNFSNTRSFGLPIGGPAARILSELVLDQIDRLLKGNGVKFVRFADDYHIFADSLEQAYEGLIFLSETLSQNQGLSLQKSKTRIMSGSEFIATSPLPTQDVAEHEAAVDGDLERQAQSLLRFSIRFDPYSQTAEEDYESLKAQMKQFDILGLLKSELSKSRVHTALSRKIVSAIRFLDPQSMSDAVSSLIDNLDLLYPIIPSIMTVLQSVFDDLDSAVQKKCHVALRQRIMDQSHIMRVDLNLAYAIRVLAKEQTAENVDLLQRIYQQRTANLIRRDIILVLAKWKAWYWLSDLRNSFRTLSPSCRRAFIIASFALSDEGHHWRRYIKDELSPFEQQVGDWAAKKVQDPNWSIPI